jgi:hypothetical protein
MEEFLVNFHMGIRNVEIPSEAVADGLVEVRGGKNSQSQRRLSCRYPRKSGFRILPCEGEKDSDVLEVCYDDGRD